MPGQEERTRLQEHLAGDPIRWIFSVPWLIRVIFAPRMKPPRGGYCSRRS